MLAARRTARGRLRRLLACGARPTRCTSGRGLRRQERVAMQVSEWVTRSACNKRVQHARLPAAVCAAECTPRSLPPARAPVGLAGGKHEDVRAHQPIAQLCKRTVVVKASRVHLSSALDEEAAEEALRCTAAQRASWRLQAACVLRHDAPLQQTPRRPCRAPASGSWRAASVLGAQPAQRRRCWRLPRPGWPRGQGALSPRSQRSAQARSHSAAARGPRQTRWR